MKFGKLAHTDFGDWPTVNYKELKRFLSNSTLDAVSSAEFVHELAAMLAEVDDAFVSQETAIIDALAVAAPGRPSSPKERFESVQLHNRRSSVDSMRRSSQEPGLCFGGSNSGAGERLTPTCAVPIGTRVPGSTPPACERFTKSAPLVDAAVWPTGGSPAARTFGGGPATSSLALVIANPHGYDGGRGYGASVAMSAAARTSAEMSQSVRTLRTYCLVQFLAVLKISKKHDKHVEQKAGQGAQPMRLVVLRLLTGCRFVHALRRSSLFVGVLRCGADGSSSDLIQSCSLVRSFDYQLEPEPIPPRARALFAVETGGGEEEAGEQGKLGGGMGMGDGISRSRVPSKPLSIGGAAHPLGGRNSPLGMRHVLGDQLPLRSSRLPDMGAELGPGAGQRLLEARLSLVAFSAHNAHNASRASDELRVVHLADFKNVGSSSELEHVNSSSHGAARRGDSSDEGGAQGRLQTGSLGCAGGRLLPTVNLELEGSVEAELAVLLNGFGVDKYLPAAIFDEARALASKHSADWLAVLDGAPFGFPLGHARGVHSSSRARAAVRAAVAGSGTGCETEAEEVLLSAPEDDPAFGSLAFELADFKPPPPLPGLAASPYRVRVG